MESQFTKYQQNGALQTWKVFKKKVYPGNCLK